MNILTFLKTTALAALLACLPAAVVAIDFGGAVKDTAKGVAKGQIQKEYNKRLAKEKCRFVGNSATDYTGCNLDKIVSEMNAFRTAFESSGAAGDVDIVVYAFGKNWDLASKRADALEAKVKSQLRASWDYQVKYDKVDSNEIYFQIAVD